MSNSRYKIKKMNEKIDVWEWLIYRRISRILLKLIIKTNLTPNNITSFSLIFSLIAGVFLINGNYFLGLFAALCIFLTDVFDCLDGDLARSKKIFTAFGSYFDAFANAISQYIFYFTGTIGLFLNTNNSFVIFSGMFALCSVLLIVFLSVLGKYFISDAPKHAVNISKRFYISAFMSFNALFIIGLLLNRLYYIFWFIGAAGMVIVLKQIIERYLHSRRSRA